MRSNLCPNSARMRFAASELSGSTPNRRKLCRCPNRHIKPHRSDRRMPAGDRGTPPCRRKGAAGKPALELVRNVCEWDGRARTQRNSDEGEAAGIDIGEFSPDALAGS